MPQLLVKEGGVGGGVASKSSLLDCRPSSPTSSQGSSVGAFLRQLIDFVAGVDVDMDVGIDMVVEVDVHVAVSPIGASFSSFSSTLPTSVAELVAAFRVSLDCDV